MGRRCRGTRGSVALNRRIDWHTCVHPHPVLWRPHSLCFRFPPQPFHWLLILQAQWRRGLAITLSTIFGAVLLGLLGLYALHCWRAGRLLGLPSPLASAAHRDVVTHPGSKPVLQHSDSANSSKLGSSGSSKLGWAESGALAIDMESGCQAAPRSISTTQPAAVVTATRARSLGRPASLAAPPRSALLAQMQSPFEAQANVEFAAAAAWAAAFHGGCEPGDRRTSSGSSGSGLRDSNKFDSALDALEGGLAAMPHSPKTGKPIQLKPVGSLGEHALCTASGSVHCAVG